MAFLTKYGTQWGVLPMTTGKVLFVAPTSTGAASIGGNYGDESFTGNDGNDGLSPQRPLATVSQAYSLATANQGDIIVLLPGTHTLTAQLTIAKAGLTIMGLPVGGSPHFRSASLTTSASDEIILVSAARVTFKDINFISVTAQAAVEFDNSGDHLSFINCSFDMYTAAASTATMGIQSLATSSGNKGLYLENCYFETLGAQGPYLDLNDCVSVRIVNTDFRHTGATALADGLVSATGAVDVVLKDCNFINGTSAVMTDAVDWTGNTDDASLQLIRCTIGLGSGINASADADVVLTNSTVILQVADGASGWVNVINAS